MPNSRRPSLVGELTPQELRFCKLRARGYSGTQAYREAFPEKAPSLKMITIQREVGKLQGKPYIVACLKDLFRHARKQEMLSHAEYLDELRQDRVAAKQAKNWTAVAAFDRLIGQAIGSLSDTLTINDERFTDEELLQRLAGDDEGLAELLKRRMGTPDAFDA